MRKLRRGVVPTVIVLAAVAGWGVASVYGADRPSAGPQGASERGATIYVAKDQALLKTYLVRKGLGGTTALSANTFTPVGPNVKVKCPGSTGACVVAVEVNVHAVASAGEQFAVCLYLDGVEDAQTGCPWVGEGYGGYANYTYLHTYKVSPGSHSFRVNAFPANVGATADGYSYVFSVYRNQ